MPKTSEFYENILSNLAEQVPNHPLFECSCPTCNEYQKIYGRFLAVSFSERVRKFASLNAKNDFSGR